MRRRIYWLLPDLASARVTMGDLLLARVPERHIHFVAREGADMSGLHAANVLQTSDVVRSAQMGLGIGAGMGALFGALVALAFPFVVGSPHIAVVALTLLGGAFGAWSSSMIGISTPSLRLKRFEPAIDEGRILLMVDVPHARIEEIEARLQALHPEARLQGVDPHIPAFP